MNTMNGFPKTQSKPWNNNYIAIAQLVVVFSVLLFALVNLTLAHGDLNLWMNVLAGTLGYLIPSPIDLMSVKATCVTEKKQLSDNGLPGDSHT